MSQHRYVNCTFELALGANSLSKLFLQLFSDRLQAKLFVSAAVRSTQMRGQDDRLGALFERVLDGRQGRNDPSRVGDCPGFLVLRAVEVDPRIDFGND